MRDPSASVESAPAFPNSTFALPDADRIVAHIVPELRSGDVVAIMSNGGFGGIHEKILSALQSS